MQIINLKKYLIKLLIFNYVNYKLFEIYNTKLFINIF